MKPKTLCGATKGTFRIVGDIVGPIVEDWNEEREWRNIIGEFDGTPIRDANRPANDRADVKARKGGKRKLRRRAHRG
jgi:hypothetical protein